MQIVFRKKTKSEWAILFIFFMPFVMECLTDLLGMPDSIKYTIDVAWIGLLIGMLNKKRHVATAHCKKLLLIAGAFFGLSLIGLLLNYQSILYYLWGIRNNARFFVYFFACLFFINAKSAETYLSFFDKVFWVNIPVVLYQFFFLGKEQDYLGGIFGTAKGCNSYINLLLVIVTTKSLVYCIYNKEKITRCLIKCAIALLIAALSELKSFYVEFIIIVAISICFAKPSYKKLIIAVGAAIGIVFGVRLIGVLFPTFADWFSLNKIYSIISNERGYTGQNDMNRLTAVSIAWNRFLPKLHHKLFGLGLGNCDYAAYDFLITPFYRRYGVLNYVWFSSAFLILETGLVGIGLYIAFFVQLYLSSRRMYRDNPAIGLYCQMSMIFSVISGFIFILNSTLRTEAAFLMYFVLSIPFALDRASREEKLK